MKNFTKAITLALAMAIVSLHAQQWSDVGDQGFTPNIITASAQHMEAAITGTTPYVTYVNTSGDLIVMKFSGGSWTALPSPASGPNILYPTIKISNTGEPYVAYTRGNGANVKKFNGTAWVQVGIADINTAFGSATGYNCSLDFDSQNAPYVAYLGGTNNLQITLVKFDGSSWVAMGGANFDSGSFMKLAISSANVPYVVSSNGTILKVKKFDGASWVSVGPSTFSATSRMTDIVIDASGVPYVLSNYNPSGSTYKLTILKFNGATWGVVGVSYFNAGSVGEKASLGLDNADVPYVTYQDVNNNNLATVMKFNGTSWVTVGGATTSPSSGKYPSLVFDSGNTPHLAYHDGLAVDKISVVKFCTSTASISATTPGVICGTSGTASMSATGSGTFFWYNTSGLKIGAGTTYTTPTLSATTSYSVTARDGNGCATPRSTVVATLTPLPTITFTTAAGACSGSTVSIQANPSAGTVNWYAAPSGGSSLGTGTTFITPALTSSTTYYAEALNSGCASASRTGVLAVINSIPSAPTALISGHCGPGVVTVSVTAGAGTVQWFTAPSGGSTLQTGTSYTTPSLNVSTTYYADLTSLQGCVSTNRTAVVANIFGFPTITSSIPTSRCGDGSVTLTVSTSGDASAQWFTAASGGTAISALKSYVTPSLNSSTTYYAEALENGCPSTLRTAVVATINPIPTIAATDVSRCDAGTVTFEAGSIGAISWFDVLTGGSVLGTGANYTTPNISASTPYFIEATLNGCSTPSRTQVMAIVNTTPPQPTITQNNSNIEAPVLTSSSSTGNQWFKDDVTIGGAVSNAYTISDNGSYKVQVTLNGCPSLFSTPVSYVITGFETPISQLLRLYPNPTTDELVVNLEGFDREKLVSVTVLDLLGRPMVESFGMGGEKLHVNVRSYQQGQYIVFARQGIRKGTKSFIKSH